MKKLLLIMVLGLVFCGASYAEDSVAERYAYKVKITSGGIILGDALEYYLTNDKVIVFGKLKREDNVKELFSHELTNSEKEKMNDFLAKFPLSKLENKYFPQDSIMDGYAFSFSFKLEKNNPREIKLANTYQKELNVLVREINSFLPENLKLFADWKETN